MLYTVPSHDSQWSDNICANAYSKLKSKSIKIQWSKLQKIDNEEEKAQSSWC